MTTPNRLPALSGLSQDEVTALCAIGRQLATRLDRLIEGIYGLRQLQEERQIISVDVPEILALQLASFPSSHTKVIVETTPTTLVENPTDRWSAVIVTNLDNAQRLYYGTGTLGTETAPFIPSSDCLKIYIPPSETLYGIVELATITAGVSNLVIPR
jgi:hypothetical protein